MINRMIAALLALATILAAPVAHGQATPQFGIATSGSCRDLSVRDATLPGLVTFLCVDTTAHKTKIKTDGGSMTGDLSFGGAKKVIDLASPTSSGDATTKNYVDSNFQPVDADLSSIAALSTTSYGRSLLTGADASATRTTLGLGTAATVNTGTSGATIPRNDTSNTFSASQAIAHPTAATALFIQTIDGQEASLRLRTGTSERWRFAKNNTSETGTNAGSNFALTRFDDTGTSLGTSIFITRSNGDISLGGKTQPATDNAHSLGGASNRWTGVYTVRVFWSATVFDAFGTGSPEGVVTAAVGSTYRRTDGGAATTFYVKESGTGNTGWIGK